MIVGLDTTVLVQLEIKDTPGHAAARRWLRSQVQDGHRLALTTQVLAEFFHIVTDPARFPHPLDMRSALARGEALWNADETVHAHSNEQANDLFVEWMRTHRLGRKRILDTMLAATYFANGITHLATSNARDFAIFGVFQIHRPA